MLNFAYSIKAHVEGVASIPQATWDRGVEDRSPHLSHAFLSSLETEGCLGERVGWYPRPWTAQDASGRVIATLPLYVKENSFGEFVFDWAWAEAYQRHGLPYYPKWVVASPFTPASGQKFLCGSDPLDPALREQLLMAVVGAAEEEGISSVHFLFTPESWLEERGLIHRTGCQFHWKNRDFVDFAHFLDSLTSKRRKEVLRERRKVREAGIVTRCRKGMELSPEEWVIFHRLYCGTFEKHGNYPALSASFFQRIGSLMGEKILIVEALRSDEVVGAAFFMIGEDTLLGRYWGASEEIPALHFELCFYQGIEYAIASGLSRFEPGAQGEHKISRGFLPELTHSYHWIRNAGFRDAIARHVALENKHVAEYMQACSEHSPYRVD
jgi:uncharacterized protein